VTAKVHVETERLVLRDWAAGDSEPFAALNADPRVMEFFPRPLSREESDRFIAAAREAICVRGYGLYAAEEKTAGRFIGYVGLAPVGFQAPFTPATEVGWRLSRASWGNGYATEAARAVVVHAFAQLGFEELVSFTAEWNARSRRVMEKIGMTRDQAADFLHPSLPPEHKLARHVLYRIRRA
jgi:RimJ/RimL family protein N-acetyltransferase